MASGPSGARAHGDEGFQTVAAMILVSELGEVHRFAHPRQVMAYLMAVALFVRAFDLSGHAYVEKIGSLF
jgi:hypothetical protein